MSTIAVASLAIPLLQAVFEGLQLPGWRYTRNGGMRFLQIGRLQMSWCVCRQSL